MSIGKICRHDAVMISENATIQEAARMMADKNVGSVLVMKETDKKGEESAMPIGIITDRDIAVKAVAKETELDNVMVNEIMSTDLLMLQSQEGIKKAIEAMCSKGVRRAPVIENDKVCGVAALDDLMILLAGELSDIASLVSEQTTRQTH